MRPRLRSSASVFFSPGMWCTCKLTLSCIWVVETNLIISERISVVEKPWLMLASAPVLSDPDWMVISPGRHSHFWLTERTIHSWRIDRGLLDRRSWLSSGLGRPWWGSWDGRPWRCIRFRRFCFWMKQKGVWIWRLRWIRTDVFWKRSRVGCHRWGVRFLFWAVTMGMASLTSSGWKRSRAKNLRSVRFSGDSWRWSNYNLRMGIFSIYRKRWFQRIERVVANLWRTSRKNWPCRCRRWWTCASSARERWPGWYRFRALISITRTSSGAGSRRCHTANRRCNQPKSKQEWLHLKE